MNSSKSGSSSLDLSQKLSGKYAGQQADSSSEAIHTLANGHQMTASLPRYADGKWEKKKIRALNQRKGSLDSRSFILAASPDIPPLPASLSNHLSTHHSSYYPLPLLSLPSQPNLGDVFDAQQQDSDYFNSLHHRHHLHLHQHHLIDPTSAALAEPPSSLLLSSLANGNTLAGQNALNYHLDRNTLDRNILDRNTLERNTLDRNTLDRNGSPGNELSHSHNTGGLLPTGGFPPPPPSTNDSFLFSASEANACSHCSYELYDCHNLDASCDLMLPASSYHHLHFNKPLVGPADYHHLHGNQYPPAGHPCSTNEFSWAINDSLDYHQQNLNQSRSKEPIRANGFHQAGPQSGHQAGHQSTHQNGAQSGLPIGSLAEEEPNEVEQQSKEQADRMDEKSNRRAEAPNEEQHSARQSRLQRSQSFTVEEVDLSEAC